MRMIPRVQYVNYRREFPQAYKCWTKWFAVNRFWFGKIVQVHVRHHCIVLDFRRDWTQDMITGRP